MKMFRSIALAAALSMAVFNPASAQWQAPNHSVPLGRGAGVMGFGSTAPGAAGQPLVSTGPSSDPAFQAPSSWFDAAYCSTVGYLLVRLTGSWTCAQGVPLNVKWFGAKGDLSVDDTVAIQAAVTAANGNPVFAPVGQYLVSCVGAGCNIFSSTTPLNIIGSGDGAGPGVVSNTNVTQFMINCANCNLFSVTSVYPSIFRDFQINVNSPSRPHAGFGVYLAGTGTSNVANYQIKNLAFQNVGTPIGLLRPVWGTIEGNFFQNWITTAAIVCQTSANIEGGCGHITKNYFFGTSAMSPYVIYSEIGYADIHDNEILGGSTGIYFNIKNNPAGWIHIHDNTIENFGTFGINVATGDGKTASMVMIQNNEFSDNSNTPLASILINDSTITPAWVTDVLITGNVSRNTTASGGRHIWVAAGKNVIVSGNVIDELGANSPQGINIGGSSTNAGLLAPIQILDNTFMGTLSAKYGAAVNGIVTLRDTLGMTIASLPAGTLANGSQVFLTDATTATACTGAGTGAMAFRQNNAWKCF